MQRTLFWNLWGLRHPKRVLDFIEAQCIDIGCFTEVPTMGKQYPYDSVVYTSTGRSDEPPSILNGLERLIERFDRDFAVYHYSPELNSWTCKQTGNTFDYVGFGSALLVRRGMEILNVHTTPILADVRTELVRPRVLMSVVTDGPDGRTITSHLHGVWIPENTKGDDPLRDRQSMEVRTELIRLRNLYHADRVVFGGDLNLDLHTRALAALEGARTDFPLFNFVRGMGTKSTRTKAYRKHGKLGESAYADYVFHWEREPHDWFSFKVHNEEDSSDHAPLVLNRAVPPNSTLQAVRDYAARIQ